LRALVVRRWLLRVGIAARGLTARHIQAVRGLAESARGGTEAHLPRGWIVRRLAHHLCAARRTVVNRRVGG
jgi:hypothetical protein